jgi:phosphatidylserine/phosphatidylglycerophosphate/cardiolipin synthase-like enzyme
MSFLTLLLCVFSSAAQAANHDQNLAPGLYVNGNPDLNPALALVNSAQNSIDIEIYEMEDAPFLEAVRAAVQRHVRVRIIKDPYPVPKPDQCIWFPGLREQENWPADPKGGDQTNANAMPSCRENALPMIEEIRAAGGAVVPFYKPHLCGPDEHPDADGSFCYQHGKLIIVDGTTALLSSGNFNPDNFCDRSQNPASCNRDFSFVTVAPNEVSELSSVFEGDLTEARYALHPLVASETALAPSLTVSPYSLSPLVDFIQKNATGPGHRVQVVNQYLKEKNLNAALQAVAKSGATVEAMVTSLCAFGRPQESQKSAEQDLYNSFASAGVQLKYFPAGISVGGAKGYLHAKAIVIDGRLAWMGSVNGSNSGLNTNREFGIFFDDEDSVQLLSDTLEADFKSPAAETFEQSWACAIDELPAK